MGAILLVDTSGRVHFCNGAAAELLGLPAEQVRQRNVASFIAQEDHHVEFDLRRGTALHPEGPLQRLAITALRGDGRCFATEVSVTPVRAPSSRSTSVVHDVSAPRRADSPLARQCALADLCRCALAGGALEDLLRVAVRTVQRLLDVEAALVLGRRAGTGEAVVRAAAGWQAGDRPATAAEELDDMLAAALRDGSGMLDRASLPRTWGQHGAACAVAATAGGRVPPLALIALHSAARLFQPDDLAFLNAVVQVLCDAMVRRRLEHELRHRDGHDVLTGLPNPTLLGERIGDALQRAARRGSALAVLSLGVDRLNAVNDTLGRDAGHEVLKLVALRLQRALHQDEMLARLEGATFAVLSEEIDGERGAINAADRLQKAVAAPIALAGTEVVVTASIGIALGDRAAQSADALIGDAQLAMRDVRERPGGGHAFFDRRMRRRVTGRLGLEQALRRAVETDALELFYQPVVCLREQRIVGVEALLRWFDPVHGMVPPSAFIPLAEESGLIGPIGRWVLHEACRQAATWAADPSIDDVYVSVNLTGTQLADPRLHHEVATIVRDSRVPAGALALELTESALVNTTASVAARMARIKDCGVLLVLDGFGDSRSSLQCAKHLPFDAVKIDSSAIAGSAEHDSDRNVLAAILAIGAALGVDVVAKRVESLDRAHWLAGLGTRLAQGDGLGRAAPATEIEPSLRAPLALGSLAMSFTSQASDESDATDGDVGGTDASQHAATVTLAQAADALGVSGSTLRRWADGGRIQHVRTSGGHRRFPVSEVRRVSATLPGRNAPILRHVRLPTDALRDLADVLDEQGDALLHETARSLYENRRVGWFAGRDAQTRLHAWRSSLGAAARTGTWAEATAATRQLLVHAHRAGTSLAERHGYLERFAEIAIRALRSAQPEQSALVGTRRLFLNLLHLALTIPDDTVVWDETAAARGAPPAGHGER